MMGAFGTFIRKQKGEQEGPCVFHLLNDPLMVDQDERVIERVKPLAGGKPFKLICEVWSDPLLEKTMDKTADMAMPLISNN
jgi:hypothetical protein